ncbi:MAG: gfo/Idh/MocA family oxidoreductase [Gemmatimonadaceae bacterium]|nr:gfo/Idh/MocA family oxidoreductase [Gemmatimonadaceae bacterium]
MPITAEQQLFSRAGAPRVGVVGAGGLGVHHVRILRDLCGERFAGFVDENPGRASQVASQYQVTAYPSLDRLLDDVDALSIVVPTTAHHTVASAALARGKHVFVEKPFTVTLAEADDLLAMAREAGVILQVGHVERFNRAVRAAMPYVDGPRFIESDRLAPFNPRGSDVAAMGIPVLTPQLDIANARLTFANGAVANITASRVSRERLRKLRIFQRSGYLSLDLAAGTGEFFRLRGDFDPMQLARAPRALEEFVERVVLAAPEGEPLVLELSQFIGAVMGRNPVAVTGEEGRDALEAALRIVGAIERAHAVMKAGEGQGPGAAGA